MRRGIYLLIPLLVVSSGIFTTGPAMRLYGKPVQILPRRSWSSTSLGFFVYFTKAPQKWGKPALPYLSRGFVIRAFEEEGGRRRELAYSTLFSTVGFLGCTTSPSKCGAQ